MFVKPKTIKKIQLVKKCVIFSVMFLSCLDNFLSCFDNPSCMIKTL